MKTIFIFALFLAGSAHAANAPACTVTPFYDGYAANFYSGNTYIGFIYGMDEQFMWLTLASGSVSGFPNVPQSVPQSVQNTTNGDTFYATRIKGHYAQVLQAQDCQILLAQNGKYLLAQ